MRHIAFDPSTLTGERKEWWDAWTKDAEAATRKAIEAWEGGEDPPLDQKLWTRLKDWLLDNVFNGKCAYCESKLARSSYQAEHFRPKGRVAVRDPASRRMIIARTSDRDGADIDHPGYFWLAHNWKNLLPSCEACNTRRGKHDQFPLAAGRHHILLKRVARGERGALRAPALESATWPDHYYLDPDDLDALEQPLLLHPYRDQPHDHLHFTDFGHVKEVEGSVKGAHSVTVYDLEDGKLVELRQQQQERAGSRFAMQFACSLRFGIRQAIQKAYEAIEEFSTGKEAYSAAVMDYIEELRTELQSGRV